jgi:hypothetical protein
VVLKKTIAANHFCRYCNVIVTRHGEFIHFAATCSDINSKSKRDIRKTFSVDLSKVFGSNIETAMLAAFKDALQELHTLASDLSHCERYKDDSLDNDGKSFKTTGELIDISVKMGLDAIVEHCKTLKQAEGAVYKEVRARDADGNDPEAKPARRVVTPRLSKEDWLKQNYPGLTELPKWRFPSLVAG